MQPANKHLLIVWHSASGHCEAMARAVLDGASDPEAADPATGPVQIRFLRAREANAADLLWADAVLFGTPENFGTMSGALKDFFDRTFYPVEGRLQPLPCALFVAAGNDGSGALTAIRRILAGYGMREVQEPVLSVGANTGDVLAACRTLGMTLAAGLTAGLW